MNARASGSQLAAPCSASSSARSNAETGSDWRSAALLCVLAAAVGASPARASATAAQGDSLGLRVAPGARVLKVFRTRHELRIDDSGMIHGDLPYVSDGTAGWISCSQRVEFLDEYVKVADGRALEFTRQIRDCTINGKANVTRTNGQVLTETAPGASPLRRYKVRFTWVERLSDWTRCYVEWDGDENWLDSLSGDFELTGLLPTTPVASGASWSVSPQALRAVMAPGGNHKITPQTDKLFGRLVEIGVAGDFADALGPELLGAVTATYRGRKQIRVGEGEAAKSLEVAEVEYELNLASSSDRKLLYITAMPEGERREPARVDAVQLDFTFLGRATLRWDIAAGRAHSFELKGNEAFVTTVSKTLFDGRGTLPMQQIGRYSGPLELEIEFSDGTNVTDAIEPPKRGGRAGGQKR